MYDKKKWMKLWKKSPKEEDNHGMKIRIAVSVDGMLNNLL